MTARVFVYGTLKPGQHRWPALARFADGEQSTEAPDLVIAALGAVVLGHATAEQNTAYRTGRGIDCRTVRYSAGRPRCNGCHDALASRIRPAAPGRTGPHSSRSKGTDA